MNTVKVPFLWDCQVKNGHKRAMLDAKQLEINFELKPIFMTKHPDGIKTKLSAALGLTAIRRLPDDRQNTRWVGTVEPAAFMRNLPVWQAFMLLCDEHAIAIGWDNQRKGEFEGCLLAQASHAMDWGVFDPALFTRWEVQE